MGFFAIALGIVAAISFIFTIIEDEKLIIKRILGILFFLSIGIFIYDFTAPVKTIKDEPFISNTFKVGTTSIHFKKPMKITHFIIKPNRPLASIKTTDFYTVEDYNE